MGLWRAREHCTPKCAIQRTQPGRTLQKNSPVGLQRWDKKERGGGGAHTAGLHSRLPLHHWRYEAFLRQTNVHAKALAHTRSSKVTVRCPSSHACWRKPAPAAHSHAISAAAGRAASLPQCDPDPFLCANWLEQPTPHSSLRTEAGARYFSQNEESLPVLHP